MVSSLNSRARAPSLLSSENSLSSVVALVGQLVVYGFAERGQQAVGLLRVEHFHQGAVAADVGDERAGEQRVFAVDEAFDQLRSSPSWATRRWTRSVKRPSFGSKYSLSLFSIWSWTVLVLVECLLQAADESVAFAAEGVGVHLAADVPQREDADLHGFDRVLVAGVALGIFDEGADDLRVVDEQFERKREGQSPSSARTAVGAAGVKRSTVADMRVSFPDGCDCCTVGGSGDDSRLATRDGP